MARLLSDTRAETVAKFIYEDIICQFGCPKTFQTDNGPSFHNKTIAALVAQFGIDYRQVSPYHPESNGLIERFNRTLGTALAKYARYNEKGWDRFVPGILAAYRFSQQSSTGFSPFQLCYGQDPRLPINLQWTDPLQEDPNPANALVEPMTVHHRAYQILAQLESDRVVAMQNLERAQTRQKKNHDRRIAPHTFKIGEKVLLEESHLKTRHDAKLKAKWAGFYYIHDVHGNGTYTLRHPEDGSVTRPLHGNRLKVYIEDLSAQGVHIDPASFIADNTDTPTQEQ